MATMPEQTSTAPQRPARKRPPPRLTRVRSVERLTPRVMRVTVEGEELAGFGPPKPGGHMKLLFPPDGLWSHKDPGATRPPSRTYTPRLYDAAANTLTIEFALHGDGLAADWVRRARPGDVLYVAGPGGGYDIPADAQRMVLVADDTAMPAAGTVLEALPAQCEALALCEVADPAEERTFSARAPEKVRWLHLDGHHMPGSLLEREVRALAATPDTCWWVACEAGAMRRIRTFLLKDLGVDAGRVHTRGYWRLGEVNHPDHDYGVD